MAVYTDYSRLSEYAGELAGYYSSIQSALDNIINNYYYILDNWDSDTKDYFSELLVDLIKNYYIVVSKLQNAVSHLDMVASNNMLAENDMSASFRGAFSNISNVG